MNGRRYLWNENEMGFTSKESGLDFLKGNGLSKC